MIPQGFSQVPTYTTYQHLPGSIASLSRQDNGNPEAVFQDLDPRENFVAWKTAGDGLCQNILSPKGSSDLSMLRRFQRGDELSVEKETMSASGEYRHLEVRQDVCATRAHLTVGHDGGPFQDYLAEGATAQAELGTLNQEFESQWNIR